MSLFNRLYDDVLPVYEIDARHTERKTHPEGKCGHCPLHTQCASRRDKRRSPEQERSAKSKSDTVD